VTAGAGGPPPSIGLPRTEHDRRRVAVVPATSEQATPYDIPVRSGPLLVEGRAALDRGEWSIARASFESSLHEEETAEALLGLSEALWWLGETDGAVRCAERAYAGFRRRDDLVSAALAAVSLYFHCRVSLGNLAAAHGWLRRAARIVEESDLAPLAGWILLMRAHDSGDPAESERCAREARTLALRFEDVDLELCALSQLGVALVEMGRVEEGGSLLDEAMVAALGGECENPKTVVFTSCNMISACGRVAELERATQWIRASDDFTRRYGSPHLYTTCRTYYGAILFATGQWAEAEHELNAALESGRTAERALYAEALTRLAELRLAQGRLEEAEQLLRGFEDHHATAYVVGALLLARGDAAAAEATVRRRLRAIEGPARPGPYPNGASARLEEASMLELLACAALERGALDEARATADRLAELDEQIGCEAIAALAARTAGRVLAATGGPEAATNPFERALGLFARLGLSYETARTHLLLARVAPDGETAVHEARAALSGFQQLGAERDADAAAAFLRERGVRPASRGPREVGVLTTREREVLELLTEGLTNREIAARLYLTPKTVEHHVRSVLRKLGLRSRAEAAVYAVRHLERDSTSI
jgi:DNA-binding CsgD family transcriptional regulator/tetratricopeptide (TPR) repeat protein